MAFLNTRYADNINKVVEGYKNIVTNTSSRYNMYFDKSPVIGTYYHINKEKSTVDESIYTIENTVGTSSPFKYDKITGFTLYGGFDKNEIGLTNDDEGLTYNDFSTESYVLPKTFVPTPGDLFSLDYLETKLLFKVSSSSVDTFEHSNNFYKIELVSTEHKEVDVQKQVVRTFKFILPNVGTDVSPFVLEDSYDFLYSMEEFTTYLKDTFMELFLDNNTESFLMNINGRWFYDPYLVEFIKRNNILANSTYFLYIDQKVGLYHGFGIGYYNSLFRHIEELDTGEIKLDTMYGIYLNQPLSVFGIYGKEVFTMKYCNNNIAHLAENKPLNLLHIDFIKRISNNIKYNETESEYHLLYNMIISYINGGKILPKEFKEVKKINYYHGSEMFYLIPILIYIMEKNIKNALSVTLN